MSWKDVKQQAVIHELDKLSPEERKEIIENRYCLKCFKKHTFCECQEEENDEKEDC